jgi:hypothetical protein
MAQVGGRAELGTISTAAWHGGLCTTGGTRVKEVIADSIPGRVGRGTRGMARVGARVGLGNITKDHFVCGLGNVDRPRAMERKGTISRDGWGGGSGKMAWY